MRKDELERRLILFADPAPPTGWQRCGLVTLLFVQLLQLVFERRQGWRINRQELLTDVFSVVFGYGVIGFLSETLVNTSMTQLKTSLGIATPWLAALPFLARVVVRRVA